MGDVTFTTDWSLDSLTCPLTGLLSRCVRNGAALGWLNPPPESEVSLILRSVREASPQDASGAAAYIDGDLAGFGWWRRYDRPTHRPNADVEKMVVAPNYSRRGIGRGLLLRLIQTARGAGVEQLTLDFRGDNVAAEQLYLSEGFQEYGRLTDFVAPEAKIRHDKVLHVLKLMSDE